MTTERNDMSAKRMTNGELIAKLQKHPSGMLVGVIDPCPEEDWKVEGNVDCPTEFEVIRGSEERSGFMYPPDDDNPHQEDILLISSAGKQWMEE